MPKHASEEAVNSKQPISSDLTAIAALSTTAFGRQLLALADGTEFAGLIPNGTYVQQVAGLVGDGATAADGVTLQAVLTAAVPGTRLVIPPDKRIRTDVALTCSVANVSLEFGAGASLIEGVALASAVLTMSGAGAVVHNPTIEGIETEAGFDGLDSAREGVRLDSVVGGAVTNANVTGKSFGVVLQTCTECEVVAPRVTGFGTAATVGVNYHSAVRVAGGTDNTVERVYAKSIGSAVLGTSGTGGNVGLSVLGGFALDCFDNGVYISTGTDCEVIGFRTRKVTAGGVAPGSGVKVRGSGHTVQACIIKGYTVGIQFTGNGATPDALGANGNGISILGNTIKDCDQDGITTTVQDGYYARHCVIESNVLTNTAISGGGFAAIRGPANYTRWVNNTIDTCGGTTAAVSLSAAAASTLDTMTGCTVSGNVITSPVADAIRISRMSNSTISGNQGYLITVANGDLLDLRVVTTSTVSLNHARSISTVVRTDASCSGNRVIQNTGDNGTTRSLILAGADYVEHVDTGTALPEGVVPATAGSRWVRTQGGTGTTVYVKETGSGNTGWVAK